MFLEWSSRTVKVDSRKNYSKNEIIYFVNNVNEIDVKPIKLKILYLQYDANAPSEFGDSTEIVCNDTSWLRKKKYKIPYHWVGKTKQEAVRNFFKYREQFKINLKNKIIKEK